MHGNKAGDYGMFTVAGDAAVADMIARVKNFGSVTTTDKILYEYLRKAMKKIAVEHGEVYDTAVREIIIGKIEKMTKRELSIFEI